MAYNFNNYSTGLMYNVNRPLLLFGVDLQWALLGMLCAVIGLLVNIVIGIVLITLLMIGFSYVSSKKKLGYSDYLRSYMAASGRPNQIINGNGLDSLKLRKK